MTGLVEAVGRELAIARERRAKGEGREEGVLGGEGPTLSIALARSVAFMLEEWRLTPQQASDLLGAVAAVAQGMPLTPLTGADCEWARLDDVTEYNVRCPRVKRERGVGAYDELATVFVDDDGTEFVHQPQSRRLVTFPYLPTTVMVRVHGRVGGRRDCDSVN